MGTVEPEDQIAFKWNFKLKNDDQVSSMRSLIFVMVSNVTMFLPNGNSKRLSAACRVKNGLVVLLKTAIDGSHKRNCLCKSKCLKINKNLKTDTKRRKFEDLIYSRHQKWENTKKPQSLNIFEFHFVKGKKMQRNAPSPSLKRYLTICPLPHNLCLNSTNFMNEKEFLVICINTRFLIKRLRNQQNFALLGAKIYHVIDIKGEVKWMSSVTSCTLKDEKLKSHKKESPKALKESYGNKYSYYLLKTIRET
ncbi:hypothetical protein EGR_04780 [Echinococcus granulosus]|uniref:Uncharacterized protein n=1 Tax=Echinococcus granulosus TaxID=6210 RepID=W6UH77_ECHGR|nr:hypothetical protein EGR_04780 [Echinococcus granulosus]EUB60398.1 hypothetical protein EGR_04780 [Echinococcus granulosus]